MRISVIIPVYDAQEYLDACVGSVLDQHYAHCEIILINDGSRDGSGDICQSYADRYENVKYASQPNAGPSAARNRGIQMAEGDYLLFLDADDLLKRDTFAIIDRLIAEYMPDSIISPLIIRTNKTADDSNETTGIELELPLSSRFVDLSELALKRMSTPASKVIIKRSIVQSNAIEFPSEYHIGEDIFMMAQGLCACDTILYNSNPYYIYNQNENSIMHTVNYDKISKTMNLSGELYLRSRQKPDEKRIFLCTQISMMLINFLQYYPQFTRNEREQIRDWMRENKMLLQEAASVHPVTRFARKLIGGANAFLLAGWAVSLRKL